MTHFTFRSRAVLTVVVAALSATALTSVASADTPGDPTPVAAPIYRGPAPSDFTITSVSNPRPKLVSGGQVLLRIDFPLGMNEKSIKVTVGKRNVTKAFKVHSPRYLLGLVKGLKSGRSVVTATGPGHQASITVVNHRITGPVFSGPQQKPFYCQTDDKAFGLAKSKQPYCSAPTKVTYQYRTTGGAFTALADPSQVPADAATVTVDGQTMPYIIRVERGTIDRAVYEIAAIYDGHNPSPQDDSYPGWNGKLVYTFGGGCNSGFHQGNTTGGVIDDQFLSKGYAVASSTLNVLDNNCSPIISAEAAMMVKEHFIETYGPVAFTIGWGGSGGAIQQYDIADAYPGIVDGIVPGVSFPDPVATAGPVTDCKVLMSYLGGSDLSADAKKAVLGFLDPLSCNSWILAFANRATATGSCDAAIPANAIWDPVKRPHGVICNMQSQFVNQLGRDPKTGFPRSVLDNTGIQYGLAALESGAITPAQFADLNAKVGGLDYRGDIVAQRSSADPKAVKAAYADDVINSAGLGLRSTPIIDDRYDLDFAGAGYDIHTTEWSLVMRARLDAANGTHANQVILASQPAQTGIADAYALTQMDAWLTAIKGDTAAGTLQDKVLRDKPETLTDSCVDASGTIVPGSLDDPASACASLYPVGSNTRLVAGAQQTMYVIKCQLQPLDFGSYRLADGTPITFTDDEKTQLQAAFPKGVCDYAKPSQDYTRPRGAWLTY